MQVPGRVGDAAIPGGGAYAAPWGACGSTGDGDLHIRFQPCLLVGSLDVELTNDQVFACFPEAARICVKDVR